MNRQSRFVLAGTAALAAVMLSVPAIGQAERERIVFSGGPNGGTFYAVANAIQAYEPIKNSTSINVSTRTSAGSVEILRNVNNGSRVQMGAVYSRHVYLGRNGRMKNDTNKYEDVMAVAWLYGTPAHLIVKKGSGINSTRDLVGKKVGVSRRGSGAFTNSELFFTHMGIWDRIERNDEMGYNDAAQAFGNNQLDAFWLFTHFPSAAATMAAETNDIELVNLGQDASASGFYNQYPYFSKLTIPAGTYRGVDTETPSFQDSALWVANSRVSEDAVYEMLSAIYTDEGLKHMHEQNNTLKHMSVKTGTNGVFTPWHPGAIKFWKEKGMM